MDIILSKAEQRRYGMTQTRITMLTFLKKHTILISLSFLLIVLICSWKLPRVAPVISIGFLLFGLALSVASIFEKQKSVSPRTEARRRIVKDAGILALTTIALILAGGFAGPYAGRHVLSFAQIHMPDFAMIASFIATVLVAFMVGFVVRWSILKVTRS